MDVTAILIVIALLIIAVSILGKLKLITTLIVFFVSFVILFLVMSAIPALQVEPVYTMLRSLFEGLPAYLSEFVNYIKNLLGSVA